MKTAVASASPADFAVLRLGIAGAVVFGVMAALGRRPRLVLPRHLGFIGVTQALSQLFAVWALVTGAAGRSSVLMYTMPFWVVLFARPILKERIGARKAGVIVLALAGLVIVVAVPSGGETSVRSGLIAVAGGVVWAGSTLGTRLLHQRCDIDLLNLTAWQMLFGTLALVVVDVFVPSRSIEWSLTFAGALIYLSVVANALTLFVWFYVLRVLPAGTASLGVLAVPVIGIVSGWILLGERTNVLEATGIGLMLAALASLGLVEIVERRRHVGIDTHGTGGTQESNEEEADGVPDE